MCVSIANLTHSERRTEIKSGNTPAFQLFADLSFAVARLDGGLLDALAVLDV